MSPKAELSTAELQEVAVRIKCLRQKATEHAIEIGRELLRVKASLPHGVFVKWVEKECEFKIRTAQDLMKLAREVDANAEVAALMVPSTLRVYLSKSTPPAVRHLIRTRLRSGERVSRSELNTAIVDARARALADGAAAGSMGGRALAAAELIGAGEGGPDTEIDRSRKVAELLIRRLSAAEYDYVMEGMNWGVWNRVLVWLRARRHIAVEQIEPARLPGVTNTSAAPAA